MVEFFRSWKRKLGVVALVMAGLFAGAWVRSLVCSDAVFVASKGGKRVYTLRTFHNCFVWEAVESQFDVMTTDGWHYTRGRSPRHDALIQFQDYQWRWTWNGFDLGEHRFEPLAWERTYWTVPYWSIVLLLILTSAWLLLSKPRPAGTSADDQCFGGAIPSSWPTSHTRPLLRNEICKKEN